jgi:ATP-dependent helicase HrpA
VIVIVAALSLQDPRERPVEQRPQADQLHARFTAEGSDFLTWLNLWRHLKKQQKEMGSSAFRRMCKREFLNHLRVREWQDFESQLRQVCKEMRIDVGQPADRPYADGIHQALLSGLLSHIGLLEERDRKDSARSRGGPREYLGARNARFAIFPGSVLKRKNPQFVMAGELVETGRRWGRQLAAIQPEWAERLGAHLVKRTYAEPHWSRKRAAVMARERVTLYGVPLVADRLTSYANVDRPLARELFIRHALVYGEWHTNHRFYRKNLQLLEEAEELEHRARRRDLVVDEHTLFDFYDARIGEEVVSGAHFDRWWKERRRTDPELLTFDPAMLTHAAADEVRADDYPEVWRSGGQDEGLRFPISYHFEPGTAEDGLTIEVPVATLNQVSDDDFSWNVPGLREELVTALIRSLPKNLRVSFVPAPDRARAFLASVPAGDEPLLDALERWARSTTGVVVPRDAWDWSKVPEHLRPTYRVVDEAGTEQARGKDLEALKEPLRPQFAEALAEVAADSGLSRTGETTWVFGDVPGSTTRRRAGHEVVVHPALVDEGTTVGLGVFGSADEAAARHRLGVARLVLLGSGRADGVVDGLSNTEKLGLAGSPYASVADLVDDCRLAVALEAVDSRDEVRDRAAYDALLAEVRDALPDRLRGLLVDVLRALEGWREADRALSGRAEMTLLPALSDMKAQLTRLVHPGFVSAAGPARLRRYPAYLAALRHRRDRLDDGIAAVNRDRQQMAQVTDLEDAYLHAVAALPDGRPPGAALRSVRWMLEEYRISLFAQQVGTAGPVSDQRIRKALAAAT